MPSRPPLHRPMAGRPHPAPVQKVRDRRYVGAEWEATRKRVLNRDRWHCTSPACPTPSKGSGGKLIVHHVIAVADGGTDADHNLRTLCPTCHERTHRRAAR